MKRFTRIAIAVALFALLPAALWAQDEGITLETLAETVAALTGRVDSIEERVTVLESTPDVGFCSPSVKNYHPMTIAGISEELPDHEPELYPDISFVRLNTDTGEIIVQWQSCCTEIVTEYYDSQCQWMGFELTSN